MRTCRNERKRRIEPRSKKIAPMTNANATSAYIKPIHASPFQACGASIERAKAKIATQAPQDRRRAELIIPSTDNAIVPVRVISLPLSINNRRPLPSSYLPNCAWLTGLPDNWISLIGLSGSRSRRQPPHPGDLYVAMRRGSQLLVLGLKSLLPDARGK